VEVGGGGEIHKGRRGHDERVRHGSYVAQKLDMLSLPSHNSTIRQDSTPNQNLIQVLRKNSCQQGESDGDLVRVILRLGHQVEWGRKN
jgi:hypothetical protein